MRTILSCFISILLLTAFWAGCGSDGDDQASVGSADVTVVASTTQVADLTTNVAGDRAAVTGILSANSDPHDYEPKPSDAEIFADADLIVSSGGDLDIWLNELVESSGTEASELSLIDEVQTIEGEEGIDPHWWQDPTNAVSAVEAIRNELIAIDPDGEAEYNANAQSFIAELGELDAAISSCIEKVPVEQRKLVTSHDALGYYAERYEIDVIGAAIPALTTQAQPSAGETAELVDLIRETGVATVFPEAGVNQEIEQAIADEADATVGGELWADTLGPEGSDGVTYTEAMKSNTAKLVEGFTAGETICQADAP